MTTPLRTRTDVLHRADEVWRSWRSMATAPPLHYVTRWSVERSNGGTVHLAFESESGWALWVRFLGLHIDTTVMANSYWAGAVVDGVRFTATCPHDYSDEVAA